MADDQNQPIPADNTGNEKAQPSGNSASGGGASSGGDLSGGKPKKPKTEKQKARERERRRRRRQKSKPQFPAGKDVPLILSSKVGAAEEPAVSPVLPAPDLVPPSERAVVPEPQQPEKEEPVEPQTVQFEPAEPEHLESQPAHPEPTELEHLESQTVQPEPQQPEPVELEKPFEEHPEVPAEPAAQAAPAEPAHPMEEEPDYPPYHYQAEQPLEPSQQIFEESPTYSVDEPVEHLDQASPEPEPEPEPEQAHETEPEPVHEVEPEMPPYEHHEDVISEHQLESEKIEQAKQIMEDLHGEDHGGGLAEAPDRSWIIGGLVKTVGGIIVVVLLAIGAFWAGSSLHLPDLFKNWFAAKPAAEQLAQGDNSKVVQDQDMLNRWGFQTAKVFGMNLGDARNLAYNIFFVANYYGKLKDPIFYGETGVTAALYYGFGKETQYFANKFIYYVKYLGAIRQANLVDVNSVLNGKVRRDQALDKYIADTQAIFDQGNTLRKEINVQMDDLQVSLNSLTPNHDRFQADFFASLEQIQAEKANELIKNFIETSQKQVELRAKLAALTRLSTDYTDDLTKMKLRIEGLQKNRSALIQGVTVTPVPGSDINLVNQ